MPRDTQPAADPLVVVLEDMGTHGIGADTYSLSYAITLAADHASGEGGWPILAVHYVEGDQRDAKIGERVADFDAMVKEELQERADHDAEMARLQRDYYAGLGVHHGRIW